MHLVLGFGGFLLLVFWFFFLILHLHMCMPMSRISWSWYTKPENLRWQTRGEKGKIFSGMMKLSLPHWSCFIKLQILEFFIIKLSIHLFFNTDQPTITVKLKQTSGWSLIRNLFLLKLSLRTFDQLNVLIFVLPWIKTITVRSWQKFQKEEQQTKFCCRYIDMCMCTHTTTLNPFCWVFISGDNSPFNNFIFQYRHRYKCASDVCLCADTRKLNEKLGNWMGKKCFNPINIHNTLWYKQDENFILFNTLSRFPA